MNIIVGSGRCGTTVFAQIMSYHRQFVWPSSFLDRYPERKLINKILIQSRNNPLLFPFLKDKIVLSEPYLYLQKSYRGINRPYRDLTKRDVTPRAKKKIIQSLEKLKYSVEDQIILKITGWPRIGFFQEIFPGLKVIHIKRNPIAVVNSFLNVYFWKGWEGPNNWRWGKLKDEDHELWMKYDQSFVALAAIQIKYIYQAIDMAKSMLNEDQFLEITYEDLCIEKESTIQQSLNFFEVESYKQFEKKVEKFKLINTNDKYKSDLNKQQIGIIEDILEHFL